MFYLVLILLFLILLCVCFFFFRKKPDEGVKKESPKIASDCCGAHETCDKNSLLDFDDKIVYYDDEELDVLSGIDASEYSDSQIEQLSDVFYTLEERDVAGWLLSLQKRQIQLPSYLRDEALMIVAERRGNSH